MKTAVSIPDPIFQAAENAADRLSISRSELYAKALQEFLAAHPSDAITAKLNDVYADAPSHLDSELAAMQNLSLERDRW